MTEKQFKIKYQGKEGYLCNANDGSIFEVHPHFTVRVDNPDYSKIDILSAKNEAIHINIKSQQELVDIFKNNLKGNDLKYNNKSFHLAEHNSMGADAKDQKLVSPFDNPDIDKQVQENLNKLNNSPNFRKNLALAALGHALDLHGVKDPAAQFDVAKNIATGVGLSKDAASLWAGYNVAIQDGVVTQAEMDKYFKKHGDATIKYNADDKSADIFQGGASNASIHVTPPVKGGKSH